jgi:hypothetical protein
MQVSRAKKIDAMRRAIGLPGAAGLKVSPAPISPDNCVVASNDRVAPIVKKTSAPAAQRFGALLRRI